MEQSVNYRQVDVHFPSSVYKEILCYNMDDEKHKDIPKIFRKVSHKVSKLMNNPNENPYAIQDFPGSASFQFVTGYIYPAHGKLVGHCDNIPGWLIIVALGSAAKFWIKTPQSESKFKFRCNSGDVVIFPTSEKYQIIHGIKKIILGSCPKFFPPGLQSQRMSLQFRETLATEMVVAKTTHALSPTSMPNSDAPIRISDADVSTLAASVNGHAFPHDLFLNIMSHAKLQTIGRMARVSKALRSLMLDANHDRVIFKRAWNTAKQPPQKDPLDSSSSDSGEDYDDLELFPPGLRKMPINLGEYRNYHEQFEPRLASTKYRNLCKLLLERSHEGSNEDPFAVVIDCGSHLSRMGFCGDDAPRAVFRSLMTRSDSGAVCFGDIAMLRRKNSVLLHPIATDRSNSTLDHLRDLWEYGIVSELQTLPSNHALLPTTKFPTEHQRNYCESLSTLAFEEFGVSSFYMANDSVLALYASGRTTGLIVDIGAEYATIAPIFEGYALPHAFTRVQLGGQHISQHLYDLVVASNPTVALNYDLNDIEYQIKEKRHCFVALDQVIERQKVKEAEPTVVELTRDNGVVDKITLTSELFDACELLFDTSLFLNTSTKASERPLPQCIVDTIMSCDIDIRKDLSRNITLAGGGALLRNLAARLQQELQTLSPALEWRVVCPQEAKYSSWIGGSILGSLSTFSKMWISRVEYDEAGPSIVSRKCF